MKTLKKYLHIYKVTILDNIQYVSNIVLRILSFAIIIFVLFNLWKYMYSDQETINGYSKSQILWYVLITEGIWFGVRNKNFTNEISDSIKSGNIAYSINKPYNYVSYLIVKNLGDITIKSLVFVLVVSTIGTIFIGRLKFTILQIPFVLIALIFSALIFSIIDISISLILFWIEDAMPFHWVFDKLVLIFGTIIPIEMFPNSIKTIFSFFPTYPIMYGPAKIIIDFNFNIFCKIFLVQVIYLICTIIIMNLLYKEGVKKVNVNGG